MTLLIVCCRCDEGFEGEFCEEEREDSGDIPDLVLWLVFITLLISVPIFLIAFFCFKYKDHLSEKKKQRTQRRYQHRFHLFSHRFECVLKSNKKNWEKLAWVRRLQYMYLKCHLDWQMIEVVH